MTIIDGTDIEVYSLERTYSPQLSEASVAQLGTVSSSLGAVSRKYALRSRFMTSSHETIAIKFRSLLNSGRVVWMEHVGVYTPVRIIGYTEKMDGANPRTWGVDMRLLEPPYWGTCLVSSPSGASTLADASGRGSYKVLNPVTVDSAWQLVPASKYFTAAFRVVTTTAESFKLEICIPDNPVTSGTAYLWETHNGTSWNTTLAWRDSAVVTNGNWFFTDSTSTTSRYSYPSSTRGQQVTDLQGGGSTMRYSWMYGPNRRIGIGCITPSAKDTYGRITVYYQNDTTTMIG